MTTLLTLPAPTATSSRSHGSAHGVRHALGPLTVGVVGFMVAVAGNWIPSLWFDEAATVTSATRSWEQLFAEVQHVDAVHAAYYSLMHVVFDLVGYSPFSLRLPSAIAVGMAAALIVVLVRMMADSTLAITSGIIYSLLPRVAWSGGEGRSYAISALLAVVITLCLVVALQRDRTRWWVLYAAATLVSCTVFVYLVLVVVGHGVTVLALRNRALSPAAKLGWPRHPLRHWLAAALAAGVALVPLIVLILTEGGQLRWVPAIGPTTIRSVVINQWFWKSPGLAVIAWLLITAAVIMLIAGRRRSILAAVLLPALILPTVALIAVSAVYLPVYSPRYLTMCAPFVAIVMAVPFSLLRSRWLQVVALFVIAAFALPNLVAERATEAKEGSSWSKVAHLIAAERATTPPSTKTAIIYGSLRYHLTATTRTIEYAYPGAFAGTVDVTLGTPAADRATLWESHHPLADDLPVVQAADVAYLITSVKQDRRPVDATDLATIGWHQTASWHFRDINVVQYKFTE